jgi:predicted alpha/beta-fold hydrolase
MAEPRPPPRFVPATRFVPAAGAEGPHAQTILGSLLRPARPVPAARRRWETPDGDFVDVDQVAADPRAPHLMVLHGLEGSSRAGYVLETLRGAAQRGWGAVALNFRSCSGELNRLARSYNSGDPTDALFVIARMREEGIRGPILGIGFSLGGSVLLNLLAQTAERCPLHAGAAVSVPFDLDACADLLDRGPGLTRLYKFLFLKSLKAKSLQRCRLAPGLLDADAIRRARDIRTFDGLVSAPLFGFSSAEDYYRRCSSGPQLHAIRRPTLLLTAKDDPIAPAGALPAEVGDNPWLSLAVTSRGGHVGFIAGSLARPAFWGEAQALAFFDHVLAGSPPEN